MINLVVVPMFVCMCNGITDRQIRAALNDGASSFRELRRQLGVSSQCGTCEAEARALVAEHREQNSAMDLFYQAAPVA